TVFENLKTYLLMIFLQFGSAGMFIISMATLNQGMNRYVPIVYRNYIAAFVLAPFALVLERKIGPKMKISYFLLIMTVGFLKYYLIHRPILDRSFTYLGMKFTSATYASAIDYECRVNSLLNYRIQ
ncbi:hypothetical protein CISIN_1g036643mg, partial [Citrus sinensis]